MPEIRVSRPPTPSPPKVSVPERTADAPRNEVSDVRKFLMTRGNSAFADHAFRVLMVVCALSIFGIVLLILTELILRSDLAWHKFGFHFFFMTPAYDPYSGQPSYWDPVNGHFSALPFVYGTLVSSILALVLAFRLPLALRCFSLRCVRASAQPVCVPYGVARCDSQRYLWPLGSVCAGADFARACEPVLHQVPGWIGLICRRQSDGPGISGCRHYSRDHDFADYFFAHAGSNDRRAALAA